MLYQELPLFVRRGRKRVLNLQSTGLRGGGGGENLFIELPAMICGYNNKNGYSAVCLLILLK